MKYLVLFAIYKIFLYPLATKEKFSVLILFMNFFLLEYMSWRFFFSCISVSFWITELHECWFQRLQYEGRNEISQIWLVTVISHIPLVLADHCTSSIF